MEAKGVSGGSWLSRLKHRRRKSLTDEIEKKTALEEDMIENRKRRQSMSATAVVLPKIELDKLLPNPVIGFSDDEDCDDDDQSSSTSTPGSASSPGSAGSGGRRRSGFSSGSGRQSGPLSLKKSPVPVVSIGLDPLKPHAALKNADRVGRKYDRLLKRGPTAKDGPGFMYARRYVGDPGGDLYLEIGVTPERGNAPDSLNMVFPEMVWWPVQRRLFCKSLVCLLLDVVRVYRYAAKKHDRTGHDMCVSVNKNTRVIVQDKVWSFYDMSVSETMPILATRPVFKNWFVVSADVASEIIGKVIVAINGHWSATSP